MKIVIIKDENAELTIIFYLKSKINTFTFSKKELKHIVTKKLKILIIEDDLFIAEMLKEMLMELEYDVIGMAKNYDLAISLMQQQQDIDLCFLDINLEDSKSGFEVAKKINNSFKFPFVFLTSYSDKKTIEAAAAFSPEAYLVKPFAKIDLLTTVEIIRARRKMAMEKALSKSIVFKDGHLSVKINIDDIQWLKSDNIYVEVKTRNKIYLVRTSLESFIDELNDVSFLRTHRSFAVNMKYVTAVNGHCLIVANEKIPLSRKFRDEIIVHFKS